MSSSDLMWLLDGTERLRHACLTAMAKELNAETSLSLAYKVSLEVFQAPSDNHSAELIFVNKAEPGWALLQKGANPKKAHWRSNA
jgi:hypothetical protein